MNLLFCDKLLSYPKGDCRFSDKTCWWIHDSKAEPEKISRDMFKCYNCDETFDTKAKMMLHKKSKHKHLVRSCSEFIDKKCIFNDASCWFNHEEVFVEEERKEEEKDETLKSVFRSVQENLEPPIKSH